VTNCTQKKKKNPLDSDVKSICRKHSPRVSHTQFKIMWIPIEMIVFHSFQVFSSSQQKMLSLFILLLKYDFMVGCIVFYALSHLWSYQARSVAPVKNHCSRFQNGTQKVLWWQWVCPSHCSVLKGVRFHISVIRGAKWIERNKCSRVPVSNFTKSIQSY